VGRISCYAMLRAAMLDADLPQWLDKVDIPTVAVLTLDDGECITADILGFNDDRDELIVDVVSSNQLHAGSERQGRSISIRQVVSFEALSRSGQPWPYSDPCRDSPFSLPRVALMATLFLSMTAGSLPLFFLLMKRPYGFQAASAIVYTIFAVFFTFARIGTRTGKDLPPYMFTCPAVQHQFSRLLRRHLGCLIALFALQTTALLVRPNLADWWNTGHGRRGETPFEIGMLFLCFGLAQAEVFANRSLLDRSHREFHG